MATLLATVPLLRTQNNRWVESQRREIGELADSIADQVVSTVGDAASVSIASASYEAPEVLPDDHSEPSGPESNRRNRAIPVAFAEKESEWPNYFLFEPGFHFGVKF